MSAPPLPARFDAATIEARWQAEWDRAGAFAAPTPPDGEPFSIILPPPNVTGILTIGHMLGGTVMDALVRHHRMRGRPTLWLPGLDAAGLATQIEVRRRLAKEGVRFEELPREEALRAIDRWKEEHERRIREQLRAAGFSVDWPRYRYTMDAGSVRATREAFVRLYREGRIYRGERMVNWDPRLRTALSDLEVVHSEEEDALYEIEYAWADGAPGGLVVATVRPETIFGDVAVAVHPDDPRHRGSVGREVKVPLLDRIVPVIADAAVDPAFGAGALKITPRHDPVDREIFGRHPELTMPEEIFDESARLIGPAVPAELRGLDREKGLARTVELLRASGALRGERAYRHAVGRSERSDARVEPRLSTQWFVRMRPLAEPVVAAVRRGEIRLRPERWTRTFDRWMEGIQDWCISRQVLWGHAIPVYYCARCAAATAAVDPPSACGSCGGTELRPDPDVLDAWFTSWMWPFVTMGWPDADPVTTGYYPTSVLVTGRDIMFFWVARMMMAGYQFTSERPFSDVYFTGMLRDEQGRRMSKHLGNSPDPLVVIRERGADTLRFSLLFPNPTDEDGPFGPSALDGARNFLTKLWNLVRFSLPHVPPGTPPPATAPVLGPTAALENRWILARYARTVDEVDRGFREFEFTRAATALHTFVWHDLADRYVEIAKEALAGGRGEPARRESQAVLLFVVERTLRLLHPFVPHVTEELWHALPHPDGFLARARWPSPTEAAVDPTAEAEIAPVLDAAHLLRNLRSDEHVPPSATPRAWIRPTGADASATLTAHRAIVARLANLGTLDLLPPDAPPPPGASGRVAAFGECFLERPPASAASSDALERERSKLAELLAKARGRLADPGFRGRAPPAVVAETEAKASELEVRLSRLDEHLKEAASSAGAK